LPGSDKPGLNPPATSRRSTSGISIDEEDNDPICQYNLVSDDEDEGEDEEEGSDSQNMPRVRRIDFDLDGPTPTKTPIIIQSEEERQPTNVAAEFLRYHQNFGHISPEKIQIMARRGVLPKLLASCAIPVCTACLKLQSDQGERGQLITRRKQILRPDLENASL
jgi:hypothetical protein